MNRKTLFLVAGALAIGGVVQAQSTTTIPPDSTHMTHHRFHGPRDGYAFHDDPGENRFGRDQRDQHDHGAFRDQHDHGAFRDHRGFGHREFIHYTPEQRQQVAAINKDYRQKAADLFKQDNITLKQYKTNLLALDKEKKAKLQALLTPQQKEQLAARRKKMDESHQVMAAAHLERLRLELNLTDDQVAQIKAGQQNLHNQAEAIHANDNLLPQEKHEQMRALMMTRNDSFKTILTPDQYTKFQQMPHHRFGGHGGAWQG